jgi:hypothetical protein
MYEIIKNIVFILVLIALGYSIYFSVKYRRQTDPIARGLYQSKQNIAMGFTLVLLAIYPLYLIQGTNLALIIGILFLLIGLFNLFAGIRNQAVYRSKQKK